MNKNLVLCSDDYSIIFYSRKNINYRKDYQVSILPYVAFSIIQTKKMKNVILKVILKILL